MTQTRLARSTVLVLALGIPLAAGLFERVVAQQGRVDTSIYAGLRWRMIGPFRGGRVNGVSGVPGQPNTFYFGSVGGGVWKTTNAGRTWNPIFDSQPIASIGAIGVAPSNPNIVYVGTGEADMRSQIWYGNGMYKSTDAGKTWTHIGLDNTRQIGRVLVDPQDPDIVFVAALGHVYGANPDRGVYRTRDGGATWQKVLFKSNDVGAIDLNFDPTTSQTIYASLWNTRRPPWSIYPPSYGPGSGLYKSTDGGANWQQLTSGLPTDGVGRIGVAVAPSNRSRVYAIVDAKEGGLFRSDDAGATFVKASGDARIWGRGWYFGKVVVDPKNADLVYVSNTGVYRSRDGGRTFGEPFKGSPGGDDYHQLWISSEDSNRMILGGDQGAVISVDGLNDHPTWSSWLNQATAQVYRIAVDNAFPYWVTGAQQDSGAVRVRSRGRFAGITMRDWEPLCAGGESGYTAPDPLNPDIVYGGTVEKCNVSTGKIDRISPEVDLPTPPRHTWTLPLVFSPADQHALYFSDQYLFKTTDGGAHWARISDDMTRENPGVPPNLDAATAADAPPQSKRLGVIFSIAPSAVKAPLLWIGTDDGYIHLTQDDGKTWTNVTPREVNAWSKVVMIEASHFDANEAYAAVDRHRLEDNEPYIYRTRDVGQDVAEDHERPAGGRLHADGQGGSEAARAAGGRHGARRVRVVQRRRRVAVAAAEPAAGLDARPGVPRHRSHRRHARTRLLGPRRHQRAAPGSRRRVRQTRISSSRPTRSSCRPEPTTGRRRRRTNRRPRIRRPARLIDYYLKTAAAGPVTIEILNASGTTVRRFSSADPAPAVDPEHARSQRRLAALRRIRRRRRPACIGSSGICVPNRRRGGRGRGGRGGGGGGGGGRGGLPPVDAGAYSVKLTVNGQSYTQPLTVRPDPREQK